MPAKTAKAIPAAKLALYEKLIATDPTVERKGATIPKAKLALSNGVVMKEFVAVPPRLLARTAVLKPYLAISRAYAKRLGAEKGSKKPKMDSVPASTCA